MSRSQACFDRFPRGRARAAGAGGAAEIPGRSDLAADLCRATGSSASSAALRSMRRITSGSTSARARSMRAKSAPRPPPNVKCCVPAPPIIEFDQAGKVVQGWGGDGPATSGATTATASMSTTTISCGLATMSRPRRPYLQVHPRRQIRACASASPDPAPAPTTSRILAVRPTWWSTATATSCSSPTAMAINGSSSSMPRPGPTSVTGAPTATARRREDRLGSEAAPPPHQFRQSRALHHDHHRWAGAGLRPPAQPRAVVPQGRHVRARVLRCSRTAIPAPSARSPNGRMRRRPISGGRRSERPVPCGQPHDGKIVQSVGRVGHQLGEFYNLHFVAIDSKGNVYTAEVQGKRVQKFRDSAGYSAAAAGKRWSGRRTRRCRPSGRGFDLLHGRACAHSLRSRFAAARTSEGVAP